MLPAVNDSNYDAPNNRAAATQEREEILDRIAASVSSAGLNPVRDDAVVKTISSFSKALAESNNTLLENLVEDDKQLLKDTIKEFSNLQAKTSKEFADKLDKALKFAERLILRGETENKPELGNIGGKLKEDLLKEKFKALGIDDDPTLGQRVKRRLVGKVDVDADGNKVSGWVQGKSILKNATKDFAGGFSSAFMGGRFEGVSKTNEQRRNEIRAQADEENKKVAFVEESQRNLNAALDQTTRAGGEETTQLTSANISPDTKTKSDVEELKAGIRDTDPAFSRSSTVSSVEDNWKKLLQLLEDIKKCVCQCQCSGGSGIDLPGVPLPVRSRPRVPTRVPATAAERVAIPALAAERVATPLALPAPATVEAQGLAKQLTQARPATAPALEYKPLNDTPLNFETRIREPVPVRAAAEPVYKAQELSVAERLRTGQISNAEDAKKIFLEERAQGKTIGAAEPITSGPPKITVDAPKVTAPIPEAPNVGGLFREYADGRRANENILTREGRENWRARRAAEAAEDAAHRRVMEMNRRNGTTASRAPTPEVAPTPETARAPTPDAAPALEPLPTNRAPVPIESPTEPLPTNRAPVPVTGTAEPVAKPSMWERVKTTAGNAWEGIKSASTKVGETTVGLGKRALNLGTKAVKGTVDFTKRGLNKFGSALSYLGNTVAESRIGKAVANSAVGRAVGKVASSGAGRFLAKMGGRLIPLLPAAIGAYEEGKREYTRTGGNWKRALTVGGIAGVTSFGGELLGTAAGVGAGGLAGLETGPGAAVTAVAGGLVGGAAGGYAGQKAGGWAGSKLTDMIWGNPEEKKGAAPAVATRNGARQAPTTSIQQRPRASVQSGQNQDSAMIARSSAAVATARGVAERPVINVPPPTVIQAPANNNGSVIPHTRPHSRPEDNSWLTWQRRRTAVMA